MVKWSKNFRVTNRLGSIVFMFKIVFSIFLQEAMKFLVVCAVLFLSCTIPISADDSSEETDPEVIQKTEETPQPSEKTTPRTASSLPSSTLKPEILSADTSSLNNGPVETSSVVLATESASSPEKTNSAASNVLISASEVSSNTGSSVSTAQSATNTISSASEVFSSGLPFSPKAVAKSPTFSYGALSKANAKSSASVVTDVSNVPSNAASSSSFVSTTPAAASLSNSASSVSLVISKPVVSSPLSGGYSPIADFLSNQNATVSTSASGAVVPTTQAPVPTTQAPEPTPIASIDEPPAVTPPEKPPTQPKPSAVSTVSKITKKVNRIINFHRQKFSFYRCQTSCLIDSIRCMRSCRTNTVFILYKDNYMKCGKKCRVRQFHCKKLCKTELKRERSEQMLAWRSPK
ncbi:mucin-5AC-like [Ostrea edulis]|uniref:mucin-5AC-like n=1 Tax=Ostrea edulis TaxID=37623 RepID=UPI0024AF7E78|nr:mucin-5AC-like [Ostrea edulis]